MTPAEFRTAHDATGLTTQALAGRIGVHVQMVWRYESPTRTNQVPEHASIVMQGLLNDWEAASDRLTAEARDREDSTLVRYAKLEEFYKVVPELDGWGEVAQGLLLADVQRRVQAGIEYQ